MIRFPLSLALLSLHFLCLDVSFAAPGIVFETNQPEALKARLRLIEAGLDFLYSAQNSDGSFGNIQRNFQTALAVLAQLSSGVTPDDPKHGKDLVRAYQWVFDRVGEDGFMGDAESPHESHAVAGLMCASLLGMGTTQEENRKIAGQADKALQYSLKIQNQAVGADYFGGWTPDPKVKVNDRLVTAWQLMFLRSMEYAGHKVPKRSISRATAFVLGSQKDQTDTQKKFDKEDIGGFSYDAAGLPVISVTSAGLATMTLFHLSEHKRNLATQWLKDHPPIWYGPNFYESHFFASRGMLHEAQMTANPTIFDRYFRRLFQILKDYQNPNGSFPIPPGNAENTKVMGEPYATALAILILNVDRQLLPIDMRP